MTDITPPDPTDADRRPGDEAPPDSPAAGENVCPRCGGSGKDDGENCQVCSGTGRVTEGVSGA